MIEQDWQETNFDGLIGPSHNYAGLSHGNLASANNEGLVSNPRAGALEGLSKMAALMEMGLSQGLLPPHERPHLASLRALGFGGSDEQILADVARKAPLLLRAISSASAMWTANAATVTPASDSDDGRTHFTPANLAAMYHRQIETPFTARLLQVIFPEGPYFAHHEPIAGGVHMGDEGAANHNRFCRDYGAQGLHLYIYGREAFKKSEDLSFPGRQVREASEAIARQHGLKVGQAIFAAQSSAAINAGAFHNDVVAVANEHVFFCHAQAFADQRALCEQVKTGFERVAAGGPAFEWIEVSEQDVPLRDAVKSYLFNSQLVRVPGQDKMTLILPIEAAETPSSKAYLDRLVGETLSAIGRVVYLDVRQSMRNGGGPACLRLRVVMNAEMRKAVKGRVLLDGPLLGRLKTWVEKYYRDRLSAADLGDPSFQRENLVALDALTQILDLGSLYDFQR